MQETEKERQSHREKLMATTKKACELKPGEKKLGYQNMQVKTAQSEYTTEKTIKVAGKK